MKRKAYAAFAISLIAVLAVGVFVFTGAHRRGPVPNAEPAALQEVSTSYGVTVRMEADRRTVTGKMVVIAENTSRDTLDAIYFHLYPNTFRDDGKLTGANWDQIAGNPREPGWIDVSDVTLNAKAANYEVNGSILKIEAKGWKPGKQLHIGMNFNLRIPVNHARLSLDDHIVYFGNWLPIRAVYDAKGWALDPYVPMGDPFYSETSDYRVEIAVPKDFQIASTGTEGDQTGIVNDDYRIYEVEARKVRDFAMVVMDSEYVQKTENADGVTVRSWYRKTDNPDAVSRLHETAVRSIGYYSDKWGAYPYPEYDVVRTSGFFGGMEYPGLVFIQGDAYDNAQNPMGPVAVAHETGHQWWYGLVGSNELSEPWLDESLTQYAALRYLESEAYTDYRGFSDYLRQSAENAQAYEKGGASVGSSLDEFPDWASYSVLVYSKGAEMFLRLSEAVGEDRMDAALRKYFQQYEYKNATAADFLRILSGELGPGVEAYFQAWLNGSETNFSKS